MSDTQLGQKIQRRRREMGLSQEGAASILRISPSALSKYENGHRCPDLVLARDLDKLLETGREIEDRAREIHQGTQPYAAPRHAPIQLPPDVFRLIGRESVLTHLDEPAHPGMATPTAAVEGPAGVGKTALVVHWAHHNRLRYPDGILTVPLRGHTPGSAPVDVGTIITGMLHDLGVDGIPDDTEGRGRLLRSVLRERRMLLILDDAHDSDQVQPLIPGTPWVNVLITSRRRLTRMTLRGAAHRVPLECLTLEDSTHILHEWISHTRPPTTSEEEDALARIAALCDGLPLALRAAAELIRNHVDYRLPKIAETLAGPRRLHVLNSTALGDPNSALRTAFNASYSELDPLAARLFRTVGTSDATTITTEQASALLDVSLDEAETALTGLFGEHLLKPTLEGYTCLPLIRAYAAEQAFAAEQQDQQ